MGSLVGHVLPGIGFILIGLWHLINHIKFHALHPTSYTSLTWFPTSKIRHLELFIIMGGSCASIAMELFVGPSKHHPFDSDGTIPSYHLHNFEHSNISLSFLVYAMFTFFFDKIKPCRANHGLALLLAALAFAQELFLFHFHSTDHMGVEGQYHWLLQTVIFVSLITTLLSIPYPNSFLVSFVRSYSICLQGVWFIVMGVMLWTPSLMYKGCFMNYEEGHYVVRCHDNASLQRAKSLVNIQFSWYLVGVTVLAVSLYIWMTYTICPEEEVEYQSLRKFEVGEAEEESEAQKRDSNKSFVQMGKLMPIIPMDVGR